MTGSRTPQPESPLEKAKRLAARAESDNAKVEGTMAQRQLLVDEISDFEMGKRGAQAEHDEAVQKLDEELATDMQLFDSEIAERLAKIVKIDEELKDKGLTPPPPTAVGNSDASSSPAPAGKKATPKAEKPATATSPTATKLVEKGKQWTDSHPKATTWLKRIASSPDTDKSKHEGRKNL